MSQKDSGAGCVCRVCDIVCKNIVIFVLTMCDYQYFAKNQTKHSKQCAVKSSNVKARDEYRRTLFASDLQRVFCVHTQAIFADDEPSEHTNSFPDIRWRLM